MTLLRVSYFLLLLACGVEAPPSVSVPPAPSHTHDHGEQAHGLESGDFPAGQRVGTHGMIVFGDKQGGVFMSHIPMFHRPHDVQPIFFLQPRLSRDAASNAFIEGAAAAGPPTIDLTHVLGDSPSVFLHDSAHTNEQGARLVAEAMWPYVRQALGRASADG